MRVLCTIAFCLLASAAQALPVRVLYDNSGSMYPGYRPPGSPERRSREQLGVHFFHQSPQFTPWLNELVRRQGGALEADNVGMWTFTSDGPFSPANIHEVHPITAVRDFRAETAVANFPGRTGNRTYLTETLQEFTRGYAGIVWLITDNIVETTAGEPDAGVQRFFETLAQSDDLRSVHLFKHSFEENGHSATLAVYGILVSAAGMPEQTIADYDRKFRELFPGREHLKLKDLSIEPVTLTALQLELADRDKGMFEEGQSVKLDLAGEIRSRLTQHTVTAAHYELAVASPFIPESWAQRDLGAGSLSPEIFDTSNDDIREEIPPNGSKRIQAQLRSAQPVSFTPSGVAEWLRLAWNGATVRYTGAVRMSLSDVQVRLQRQEMAGIFGIDHASSVFAFQDVTSLSGIPPSVVPVSFALRTDSSRTAILLLVLGILAVMAAAAGFVLSRRQTFRVTIAHGAETITALRRLGTHNVLYEGQLLGRLSRGLGNGYAFHAANGNPAFTVVPSGDGETWDVRFTGGPSRRLSIKAEGGRAVQKRPKANVPASRAGPPPPPPMSRTAPPLGRPPKIGR